MKYTDFIQQKLKANILSGFTVDRTDLHPDLLPHQVDLVSVALKTGRYCIWADTGLGKAFMGLEWANHVCTYTNKPVLIVAPLGVAHQIAGVEAPKFGYEAVFIESDSDVIQGINVTNYEKLEKFDLSIFSGVVLDESSILKSTDGKTRQFIIDAFARTPYKLACSATPAPNDHMELGNQCEFVGALTMAEMLAEYFVHDAATTQKWRLKGHAEDRFWEFVSSWASYISNPAQLGYDGSAYILPPIEYHEHRVGSWDDLANAEELLRHQATGLSEQRGVRKKSLEERCQIAASIIESNPDVPWLIWCETNDESDLLSKLIPDVVEVTGSDSDTHKKDAALWFQKGQCTCNQIQNLPMGKNTIEKIEKKDSTSQKSTGKNTQKKEKLITTNIIKNIKKGGIEDPQSNEIKTTQIEGLNMPPIQNIEPNALNRQSNEAQWQRESHGSNKSMDLRTKDMMQSLSHSLDCALSVEKNKQTSEDIGCTLITAIKQDKSEGCCVQTATKGSENSKTKSNFLNQRCSICGGTNKTKRLVCKPKIFGFGMNFQQCSNVIYLGLTHSFEQYYQSIRRVYRFGQKNTVNVHVIQHVLEGAIIANLKRKEKQAEQLADSLSKKLCINLSGTFDRADYAPKTIMKLPEFLLP